MLRQRLTGYFVLITALTALLMAACDTTNSPVTTPLPATATLQGAIVPTRIPLTATYTPTNTDTPSSTPTATLTETPSVTPSESATVRPSDTPTNTPSSTPSATDTPSITPTPTASETQAASNTPTLTATPTGTETPSETPTINATQVSLFITTGNTLFSNRNYQQAVDAYTLALQLDPNSVPALVGRGASYVFVNNYPAAIADLNRALELDPNNGDAYYYRAEANEFAGNIQPAIDDYSHAIQLNGADYQAYAFRGNLYYGRGENDKALADENQAISIKPDFAFPYKVRGLIYYGQGNYPQALADFQQYVQLAGDQADQKIVDLIPQLEASLTPAPGITPSATPVTAGPETPIACGQIEEGSIQGSVGGVRYSLDAQAGDMITVGMQALSGDLDPYLILLDPSGNRIIENDDDPQGTNRDAILRDFAIPESGTYIIVATRFEEDQGTTQGRFRVTLTCGAGQAATPTLVPPAITETPSSTTPIPIQYGDTETGSISDQNPSVQYSFQAQAGDVIDIVMTATSGDLDTYLILLDPAGNRIVDNDDDPKGTGGSDAAVRSFTIPQTGTYTIVATRFEEANGVSQGDYRLTLSKAGGGTGGNVLSYGSTAKGTITTQTPSVEYTFQAKAGDVINIVMKATSGDLDTNLILRDPAGNTLVQNDDDSENPSSTDAAVRNFTIPEDGTYTIVATRFQEADGVSEGDYTLSLDLVNGSPVTPTAAPNGNVLTNGSSVNGSIDNQTPMVEYTFTAKAGDSVSIVMKATSGDLDTYLLLLDSAGNTLTENDDDPQATTGSDAAIRDFTIPADGEYTVVATRFQQADGPSQGNFTLTLQIGNSKAAGNNLITYDSTVQGTVNDQTPAVQYQFRAKAGEVVSIVMTANSGDLDTYLILLDPAGNRITENDDDPQATTGSNAAIRDYTIPADGLYTIVATRFQEDAGVSSGTFTLTLNRK